METYFLIVMIVIMILLAILCWFAYSLVMNQSEDGAHKFSILKDIHYDLDRIGSIMRENQMVSKAQAEEPRELD